MGSNKKEQIMNEDLIKRSDAIKTVRSPTFYTLDENERELAIRAIPSADKPQDPSIKGKRSVWYCPECKRIYERSRR